MTNILIYNSRPEHEFKRQTAGARKRGGSVALDLAGHVFGFLTVVGEAERSTQGLTRWECICECGTRLVVLTAKLRSGRRTCCGCRAAKGGHPVTHGHSPKGKPSATYSAWHSMITRCHCPTVSNYASYGGRGILVCDRWRTFENFLADMGEAPAERRSPDRIDNEKGYEPGNVRWASMAEQARNRRNNKLTVDRAATIRARAATGEDHTKIATDYGVSRRMVGMVATGKRWA